MIEEPAYVVKVFYAYARRDEILREDLEKHLLPLSRQKLITAWYDDVIDAGKNREEEIRKRLEAADIILLLVSANFLGSDFCYSSEMQRALERHQAGEVQVIPIILRPCDWQYAPFAKLQVLPKGARPVTQWPNRDEALQDVVKSIRRVIRELEEFLPRGSGSLRRSSSHQLWNVPYARNHFFTGREDVLDKLRRYFVQINSGQVKLLQTDSGIVSNNRQIKSDQLNIPPIIALSGMGGIGKTQVAVEYAYRYRDNYSCVFWVRGSNSDNMISDFVNIVELLRLPERSDQDQSRCIRTVRNWFATHTDWLLIFDGVDDDITTVNTFLPNKITLNGHILLTTRNATGANNAYTIEIEKMSLEEGTSLLLRRTRLLPDDAPLELVEKSDRQQAEEIVITMDGLPLALDQAGAYIEETGIDLSRYFELYQHRSWLLLQLRGHEPASHPEGVATTWELSFQKVQQENPVAADLLRFCAFFAPDAIPEEILTDGSDVPGMDGLLLNEAIETLRRFSLIKRDAEAQTLSIHRLVQMVLKNDMSDEVQQQWASQVVRAINQVIPIIDSDPVEEKASSFAQFQRYLPQALACIELITQYNMIFPEAAQLLNRVGNYLQQQGQYQEAEVLLRHALSISEQVSGLHTPATLQALANLAALYQKQQNYAQAELLLVQAQAILEQEIRPDHPLLAEYLNNLADLYQHQGRYAEAEPLLVRAITILKQEPHALPLHLVISLRDLASLSVHQGRSEQAKPLLQEALTICEQELGPIHSETATILSRLADLYIERETYEQAEALLQQSLDIRSQIFGPKHPCTAESFYSLGKCYFWQGKFNQAGDLWQQSLAIRNQTLGPEHPSTVESLYSLAVLYYATGKYTQAEPLFERIIALPEQNLESENPYASQALYYLATLSYAKEDYANAETFFRRLLLFYERSPEAESLAIATLLNSLAIISRIQRRYQEAEALFRRALALRDQKADASPLDMAQSLVHLAVLYLLQDRSKQALPLYSRALQIYEHSLQFHVLDEKDADWFTGNFVLNTSYIETISGLNELALLLQETGDTKQADIFFGFLVDILGYASALANKQRSEVLPAMQAVQKWLYAIIQALHGLHTGSSRLTHTTAITHAISLLVSAPRQLDELPEREKLLIKRTTDRWSEIIMNESRRIGRLEITQEVYSPYVFTTPIRGKGLVGREDLFKRITSLWSRPGQRNSLLIYGQRRMGKTSLAQAITQFCQLGSDTEMIYFSAEAVNLEHEGYLYYEIAYRMWTLIEGELEEPQIDQYIYGDTNTTFNKFLTRFNHMIRENRIVLIIDEFDLLYKYLDQARATKMITYLRAQTQTYHWLALAIVGLNDLRDLKRNYNSRLLGWEEMKVSFLSEGQVANILSNPPHSPDFPLSYSPNALELIEMLTYGQPFLVQVIGDMLVQRFNHIVFVLHQEHRGVFATADVQAVVDDQGFYTRAAAYFEGVWGQVLQGHPNEKEILLILAQHEKGLDEKSLSSELRQPTIVLQESLNELLYHDILYRMNNRLWYRVPLMRRWVQDVWPRLEKGSIDLKNG